MEKRVRSLTVRVRPRAARSAILGWRPDGSLEVLLRSVPAGGEANRELLALLARELALPRQAVKLLRGASARIKVVRVEGASDAALALLARGSIQSSDQRGSQR